MINVDIGERLRLIRRWRRYTQDELAALMHTTQPKISQLETGKRTLGLDDLRRFAAVLHFSLDGFFRTTPNGFDITACLLPLPDKAA